MFVCLSELTSRMTVLFLAAEAAELVVVRTAQS